MYEFPNPKTDDPVERRVQRIWEIIPGGLTWGTFIFLTVFSVIEPSFVSIFLIVYELYWIFITVFLSVHLIDAYKKLRQSGKKDWLSMVKKYDNWQEYTHLVMFPTYNEPKELLEASIDAVKRTDYPLDRIIVVLATEEREGKKARKEKEEYLRKKFENIFQDFVVTAHPDGIEGELKAKGANATWAGKEMYAYFQKKGIPIDKVILSTFDSDTIASPGYFGALTQAFLSEKNPHQRSYQPMPMYHNNIWTSPAFARVIAVSSTFWHMMESVRPGRMVTFSSHSMSFKTLVEVGFWPVNIVSDDSVIFWKCMDYYNGQYEVRPVYVSVSLDVVEAPTMWETFQNQYKQIRRWAYGIEDFPVVMRSYWRNKKVAFGQKCKRIFDMLYGHYTWATISPTIALFGWVPIYLGGDEFRQSVLSNNLPIFSSRLMTLALSGLILTAYLHILLLPKKPKGTSRWRTFMMYAQWALVPMITIFLGSLPAIEAQTRLMFGKYLGFWVTPKRRD